MPSKDDCGKYPQKNDVTKEQRSYGEEPWFSG
jgi:hypothetical protein